jgi:membrane-bound lytic murein transglycosylase B
VSGIPQIALAAYRNAELRLGESTPGCGLTWNLLAGIGRIESNHANGGETDADGTTLSPIVGPALDGSLPGNEVIRDSAGGYVRAVGPMQFLPSTWRGYADADANPNNIFDAALTAARYLCSGGLNLRDPDQELRAVLRYNNSMAYAQNVLKWAAIYGGGSGHVAAVGDYDRAPDRAADESAGGATPTRATDPRLQEGADDSNPQTADVPVPSAPTPSLQTEPVIIIPGLPPIPCGILCLPLRAPSAS